MRFVDGPTGCLIDVYETVLSCDFAVYSSKLQRLAGVSVDVWNDAFVRLGPGVTDGRVSMDAVYSQMIRATGREPIDRIVSDLVRRDRQVLIQCAELYEDTIPFLENLQARGVLTALVSNCAENTRPLLMALGLADLVDALVLSCEIGYAKPSPEIYRHALRCLGVAPGGAVLVDDQAAYCEAAAALGIKSVRISRSGNGQLPSGDSAIGSLAALESIF